MSRKAPAISLLIIFIAIGELGAIDDSRLVAQWKMDETSGTAVSDAGENMLNATLSNAGGSHQ